jgi:predicted RNA-binding Zn-ribbon protein involved in translation (DUF1610 family)
MGHSRVSSAISNLEQKFALAGASIPCPECGHVRDGSTKPTLTMDMTGDDSEPGGPETCPRCGTLLILRLEFDDRG